MRVIVCGGRDFAEREKLFRALDGIGITTLIEGGCPTGADKLAKTWAKRKRIPVETFEPEWDLYGKAAGPRRNQRMIEEGKPDLVIGFRGGAGTRDCCERAASFGVPVKRIE